MTDALFVIEELAHNMTVGYIKTPEVITAIYN